MASIRKRGLTYGVSIRRRGQKPAYRTFATRAAAERWARQVEALLDQGAFVDQREAERTTLAEALDRYLTERTPTKKGAAQEAYRIHQWQRDPLARRSLASIRSGDIASWRDRMTAANKAPSTVRNALTVVSQIFVTAASDWGMEGLRNPVRGIRLPSQRPGRDRRLIGDEEARLLAAADQVEPYLRPFILLALETAMRRGELLALRRSDIKGTVAHLRTTKNNRARAVPLSSPALTTIAELPLSIDGRLFPISVIRLAYAWRRACQLAGIDGLRTHDLRHEATSRLFETGRFDLMEVATITGHRSLGMLARYTHLRAQDLAKKLG
jgi:integrase